MARTNKYTSLNFNNIYEKKIGTTTPTSPSAFTSPSKSPSSSLSSAHQPNKSYSFSASSRLGHGGMLVLSRPTPKPTPAAAPAVGPPSPSPPLSPSPSSLADTTKSSDWETISLRPQGKTGSGQPSQLPGLGRENKETSAPAVHPKTDKFVPPHLRPGYVAREQTSVPPEFQRSGAPRPGNHRPGSGHGHHGSPNRYGENGRPKSGGGCDRRMRGVGPACGYERDLVDYNRPRSGGTRSSSSG